MKREDASKYLEDAITRATYVDSEYVDSLEIDAAKEALTALNEPEIVHCKDCTWFESSNNPKYPEDHYCSYDNSAFSTDPEGFCHRGNRRKDFSEAEESMEVVQDKVPTELTAVIVRASDTNIKQCYKTFSSLTELLEFINEFGDIIIRPNLPEYVERGILPPYDIIIYDDYIE